MSKSGGRPMEQIEGRCRMLLIGMLALAMIHLQN
jgi:hypothetical protein